MLLALLASSFAALPEDWTTLPPLTADPAALLAAAAGAPADEHGAHVLLDEATVRLHPGNRVTREYHRVFVITTRTGADDWGMLGAGYASWYESPPTVEARVITPDGEAHGLDPSHVADGVEQGDPSVLGDRRVRRAPLPALTVGAVVEQHVVVDQHAPYFSAGEVHTLPLWTPWPVDRRRVVVVAEPGVDFQTATWPEELEPVETKHKGERRIVVDLDGTSFESVPWEPDRPDDEPDPALFVSTARDWRAVASAYAGLVDAELAKVDLGPRAAAARGNAKERDEVVRRLLAAVRELRYVAVELGSAAITPRSPKIAFDNGYGDCKDKALALVGLLRASGIEARVALVNVGPGPDVAPLPGLDEFDHMIVVVGDDLWIDPTSDFTPLGELPLGDQGRRALVIDPKTSGLVKTPVAPSDRSVHRFEREARFSERGPGTLIETQTTTGWIADTTRWDHLGATEEQRDAYYGDRARDTFSAKLGPVTMDPSDPARFSVRVEMTDATSVFAAADDSAARFAGGDVLRWLPDWLLVAPEEGAEPRKSAVALVPHRAEVVLRVVPPEGQIPHSEPEPFDHRFGPLSWTQTVEHLPDHAVVVTARLDTGDGRLTATEAQALWNTIAEYGQQEHELVVFRDPILAAFEAGKVGEAVTLGHDAVKAHPDDARRRDRYARVLLASGFGTAAVEQARIAAQAAPDDAELLRNLAFAQLHDRLGKLVGAGFDRAGALATLDRAIALEPDDAWAWQLRAIAYEQGDDGVVYGPGSQVDLAVAALQERRKRTGERDLDRALANHLAQAQRWDELAAFVDDLAPDANPIQYRILLAAAKGGADAALAVPLGKADPAVVRVGLAKAAGELYRRRDYPGAAKLLDAAARKSEDPTALAPLVQQIGRMQKWEEIRFDPRDPVAVVRRNFASLLAGIPEKERRPTYAHDVGALTLERPGELGAMPREMPLAGDLGALPLAPPQFADFSLAATTCRAEGEAAVGWRVTCSFGASSTFATWLVEEKGAPRVRATPEALGELGWEAASRFDRGDAAGGRQWLAWFRDAVPPVTDPADPFSGPPALEVAGEDDALAALLAATRQKDRAKRLEKELTARRATAPPELALQIDRGLMEVYGHLERYDDLRALAERLHAEHPDALQPAAWIAWAAGQQDRAAEALPVLRAAAAAHPKDPSFLRAHADLAVDVGEAAEGLAAYEAILALGAGTDRDYNQAAWFALTSGDPKRLEDALAWGMRSTELARYGKSSSIHTLASVLAELGRTDEAHALMAKGRDVGDRTEGQDLAWLFLQGRLAEAWGLVDLARGLYAALPAPEEGSPGDSVRRLARERLAALPG